jgi:carboxylesterase
MWGPATMFSTREQALREQKMHGDGPREFFAEGRAPALVAFHGFGGTAAELLPMLRAVASAGFAVDAAALPGHGARVEDLQEQTFDSWLAGARSRANAAAAKHGRVVLLGFSMGSLLALQLASERPPWLTGLVAMGNAVTVRAHTSVPLGLWNRSKRPMPDLYFGKPFAADLVDPTLMDTIVTYDRHPLRAALEVYRGGDRVRPVVARIDCPTLVLHGRRDHVCHWKNATWLASHVSSRDVSVRIFEQSAHVLACDGEREVVAAEVVRFMKRF